MLRIAIDVRDARIARTGARTWVDGFSGALDRRDDVEVLRIEPRRVPMGSGPISRILGHLSFLIWKQIVLPIRVIASGCDVLICPDYVAPLALAGRSVPVFYDVSFWINPENYNALWRRLFCSQAELGARFALRVLTISEFSGGELSRVLGIKRERIIVAPLAPKDEALSAPSEEVCAEILAGYGIRRPYILHVGVLEKRKNLSRLVRAFAAAVDDLPDGTQLVLAGPAGPKTDLDDSGEIERAIDESKIRSRVVLTGMIPNEHLGAFYRLALAYVFPSWREGFGIPVVEAMAWGVPVAASSSGSLPEVVGEAGIIFDGASIDDIADALRKIVEPSTREALAEAGRTRVRKFTWDGAASIAVENLESVLGAKR